MQVSIEYRGEWRDVDLFPFLIGRDGECDLRVEDARASRFHARLVRSGSGVVIEDTSSSNGVTVDGHRIERAPLTRDHVVELGETTIRIVVAEDAPRPVQPPPGFGPSRETTTIFRQRIERNVRRTRAMSILGLIAIAVTIGVGSVVRRGGDDRTASAIIALATPGTVQVLAEDNRLGTGGSGTGWVYDAEEGLVVTNHHVAAAGTSHSVRIDGDERTARLLATSPCEDLAILRVDDPTGLVSLPLGDQSELRLGDTVVAVGFPAGLADSTLTATVGVVSVVSTALTSDTILDVPLLPNVIRTDAAINPGNSGGPLLSLDGEVVGVSTAGTTLTQNENYAIGIDRVRTVLADLELGTSSGWAGVSLDFAVDGNGNTLLVATSAVPGSPAEEVGFGSEPIVIRSIDGVEIDGSLAGYCAVVGQHTAGSTAAFDVVGVNGANAATVTVEFL